MGAYNSPGPVRGEAATRVDPHTYELRHGTVATDRRWRLQRHCLLIVVRPQCVQRNDDGLNVDNLDFGLTQFDPFVHPRNHGIERFDAVARDELRHEVRVRNLTILRY